MGHQPLTSLSALASIIAILLLVPVPTAGQSATTLEKTRDWTPPQTPWGEPNLQGIWSFATITPLERPREFADREVLTDDEVTELNQEAQTLYDNRKGLTPEADVRRAYNQFWWDRGKSTGRTSLIVDPSNARVPPLTPEAQKRLDATRAVRQRPAHGPEDRSLAERCIQYRPLPRLPTGYNNNYQIFQTPGYIAILVEMIHHVRIIPLDNRPHIGQSIPLWNGDSRGHWEGNTLVVDTTNFSDKTNFRGSGTNLRLVERFTRVNAKTIDYQFTVEDPTTWARPWTAVLPFTKIAGPIYEYACHEGNYGMFNLLAGARAQETAAEEAAETKSR